MKLHLQGPTSRNAFTGYGEGFVLVNGERFERSLIVLPESVHADWEATRFEALAAGHFARIVALAPELVLLGTGATLRFPRPELTRSLHSARIGLEVMDTFAACRTYNILMAEDRKVAAALLLA